MEKFFGNLVMIILFMIISFILTAFVNVESAVMVLLIIIAARVTVYLD